MGRRTLRGWVTATLVLALALVGMATLPPSPAAAASPGFVDVPSNNQFHREISWLDQEGISTGWTEPNGTRTFRPLQPVARDAMAAFLYRLAGRPEYTPPARSPFRDVPTSNMFYKEIAWLSEQDITTGWPDGTYRPLSSVNRDAMAAFMYRFAGRPAFREPATSPFSDITPGVQFYREMAWLASQGISTGWPEPGRKPSYRPVVPVARDAMAAFMFRLHGKAPDPVRISPDFRPLTPAEESAITAYDPKTGRLTLTRPPASTRDLVVGDVIAIPPRSNLPSGTLRRITSVTATASTQSVATADVDLMEVVNNTPTSDVPLTVLSSEFIPTDGVTHTERPGGRSGSPAGSVSLVIKVDKKLKEGPFTGAVAGSIEAEPVLDFEFDTDWGSLKRYKVGAGLDLTSTLTLKVEASKSPKPAEVELGVHRVVSAGMIGVVPVWIQTDTKLVLEASASGALTVTVASEGTTKAGVQSRANGLAPEIYGQLSTTKPPTLATQVSASLTVFGGAKAKSTVYSLAGPFMRVGLEAKGTIKLGNDASLSCAFTFGPLAEGGFTTADWLEKLTGESFKAAASTSTDFVNRELCGIPPLAITTTSLPAAAAGQPYKAVLKASGGRQPYAWSATNLPAGLRVNATTGEISGTPSVPGVRTITVAVSAPGGSVSRTLRLEVKAPTGVQPITPEQMLSAPVPALCDNLPGQFVNGRLPEQYTTARGAFASIWGIDAIDWKTQSFASWVGADGKSYAALVVSCSQGGVGWPPEVVFYSAGPRVLGSMSVGAIKTPGGPYDELWGRQGLHALRTADGGIQLDVTNSLQEDEAFCCGTMDATVAMRWNGSQVVGSVVQLYREVEPAKAAVAAINAQDAAAKARYFTPDALAYVPPGGWAPRSPWTGGWSANSAVCQSGSLRDVEPTPVRVCRFIDAGGSGVALYMAKTGFGEWIVSRVHTYPPAG